MKDELKKGTMDGNARAFNKSRTHWEEAPGQKLFLDPFQRDWIAIT